MDDELHISMYQIFLWQESVRYSTHFVAIFHRGPFYHVFCPADLWKCTSWLLYIVKFIMIFIAHRSELNSEVCSSKLGFLKHRKSEIRYCKSSKYIGTNLEHLHGPCDQLLGATPPWRMTLPPRPVWYPLLFLDPCCLSHIDLLQVNSIQK